MEEIISGLEMRRRAPLHFFAKADNARMAARYLWDATDTSIKASAEAIDYTSSSSTATFEAFRRESSLALELVIKAVIARRVEQGMSLQHVTKVRATHNLPELWKEAQLPELERGEKLHLLQAAIALHWAGRYAAPLSDEIFERDMNAVQGLLEVKGKLGNMVIRQTAPMSWSRFDRIYLVAANSFWDLSKQWASRPPET